MFYSRRPFVRLLFFLLAGFFVARFIPASQSLTSITLLAVFLFILTAGILLHLFTKSFRLRWLPGFIMGLGVIWAGLSLYLIHMQRTERVLAQADEAIWSGRIMNEPLSRKQNLKMILQIRSRADSFRLLHPSYKVLAYVKKDSDSLKLHLGDILLFKGRFVKPAGPKNPEEFDYRNYLNNLGINYVVFISKGRWKVLPSKEGFSLSGIFSGLRHYLLQQLKNNGLRGNEYAVAAAILLGDEQLIDPQIHQNYAAAGAVHILCVSGMHVGIIFLIFSQLLFFLNRKKYGRWLKNTILVLLIWAYALLTGLSPSVTRAATMISLFIMADSLQRSYDPCNVLAASAFLLLVVNPMLLFNVGFQLSYAAVLGIIIFYQPIFRLLYFKSKVARILWAAVVVSFSAQMGAFPVAAHYFHLFPDYFLITNLAIFGLAYLILTTGIALMLFSWFIPMAKVLGIILSGFVLVLNKIVMFIARQPGAVQHDLYFPWFKVIFIYFFILAVFLWINKKDIRYFKAVLGSLLLVVGYQTLHKYNHLNQNNMIVYSINKHTVIDFIHGRTDVLLLDSVAYYHPGVLTYSTENNRIKLGLRPRHIRLTDTLQLPWFQLKSGLAVFGHFRLFIVNPANRHFPYLQKKIPIDMLIYRGNRFIPLPEIRKSFQFQNVIIDASTSFWVRSKIQQECKQLNIKCFDLQKMGAYILKQ